MNKINGNTQNLFCVNKIINLTSPILQLIPTAQKAIILSTKQRQIHFLCHKWGKLFVEHNGLPP